MGVIAGQPGKDAGAMDFDRAAPGPDVLVVVVEAGSQVRAEPVAGQPGQRATNPDHAISANRGRSSNHPVGLVVAAVSGANREMRLVVEPPGNIFHCAADGVAAIERALRAAQHFDPLDIVDIEHGGLRTVEVNIVEVDADALFKA